MNRLKKILLLFVLPFFCLLISVSNAVTSEEALNVFKSSDLIPSNYWSSPNIKYFGFIYTVKSTGKTYQYICFLDTSYPLDPSSSSNTLTVFDKITSQEAFNSSTWYINSKTDTITLYPPFTNYTSSSLPYKGYYYSTSDNIVIDNGFALMNSNMSTPRYSLSTSTNIINSSFNLFNESVRLVENINDCSTWDGESYYYETSSTPDEPDTPFLPSNADIAKAVQAFYNSDYYKNNTDFDNFMVLYNYDTKYFDFIGHNFGIDLGQVIVPPNYEYKGYSYNQDWWKFFLRNITSEIASNLWNRYYWLYSTSDFGEKITYEGKGSIKDLINLHFSTKSIIVYSTTDYPVVKIETNEETGVLEPVEGTIPGDQYTYDETLDPTTNEYNPLENFVPTNPIQDILGDVDFDEINKTFEDNKNILDIENASWLFTANNNFISYFIGFLSLLIVFLLISRILGG